jgi:hypothetical protein
VEYKNDTIASLKIAGENPNDKASRRDITVPFWMFWRVFGGSNQVSGNNGKETQEYTLVHGGKTLRLTSTDSNERVIQVLRAAEVKGKSLGD